MKMENIATCKVMSGWVPICGSVHSWRLYTTASLGPPSHHHHDLLSHSVTSSWHWANQSLPYLNNAKQQGRKKQVSILMSLVWLDHGSNLQDLDLNPRCSDSLIFQHGRQRTLYSFSATPSGPREVSADHYTMYPPGGPSHLNMVYIAGESWCFNIKLTVAYLLFPRVKRKSWNPILVDTVGSHLGA